MTDHEMRIRLAEAMGWDDIYESSPIPGVLRQYGTEPAGALGYDATRRVGIEIPDPLNNDTDAARLRAWCVGRGWEVEAWGDPYHAMLGLHRIGRGEDSLYRRVTLAECRVWHEDEPDPCRRERLALCRAVCQALEVER